MADITIKSKELLELNQITGSGLAKDFAKKTFWYYTNALTASKIIDSCSFWVSNLSNMNDLSEVELHSKESDSVFALCFCNSQSEKIPMWYLYGGLAGCGTAIGFTPGNLLKLMQSINTVEDVESKQILFKGKDFEIKFGWIYYRDKNYRYNYKNKWYVISPDEQSQFYKSNYFIKDYPWEYEDEFRFVFINKTNLKLDRIKVSIPNECLHEIKIKFGPETKKEEMKKIISTHPEIKKLIGEKITYSNLQIKMSLIERNINDIKAFLVEIAQRNPSVIDATKLNEFLELIN